MERDSIQPANAKRQQPPLILEPAELALDGGAAGVGDVAGRCYRAQRTDPGRGFSLFDRGPDSPQAQSGSASWLCPFRHPTSQAPSLLHESVCGSSPVAPRLSGVREPPPRGCGRREQSHLDSSARRSTASRSPRASGYALARVPGGLAVPASGRSNAVPRRLASPSPGGRERPPSRRLTAAPSRRPPCGGPP